MIEIALKDLCLKITDGSHFSPKEFPGGMPMASVKDMTDLGLDLSNCKTISKQDFDLLVKQNCQPQKGDVLLAKDGNTYLKYIFSCKETVDVVLLSSIAMLRPNQEIVSPQYLAYYLSAPNIKGSMANYVSGSAIPRIILKAFREFKVNLPSLPTQNKIASILSSYDDLIENNLKRITLLEKSARLLYEEWFVNLRFPGHEHTSIVDGVPEGWELKVLEEVANVRNGFAFKSEDYSTEGIPLIRTRDFSSTRFIEINDKISIPDNLLDKYNKFNLNSLDFLLIMVGASIGKFGIVLQKDLPALQNQNMWAIYSKDDSQLPQVYLIHLLEKLAYTLSNYRVGAARDFFRKEFVTKQRILLPSKSLLLDFKENTAPIYMQINNILLQNQKLKQARDILLPKLINGEIPV